MRLPFLIIAVLVLTYGVALAVDPVTVPSVGVTVSPAVGPTQPIAPAPMLPLTLWTPIIIAGVPIVLNYAKKLIPQAQYAKYQILILAAAPILGIVGDFLSTYATGQAMNPAMGFVMGSLAVLLRTGVQEVRKHPGTPDSWTPAPPATKVGEETSAQPAGSAPVVPPRPPEA